MFSNKNKTLQILNLKDDSKNDNKIIYNLKKVYTSDTSETKTKKIFESNNIKDKLYLNEMDKKVFKKNNPNTNNNISYLIQNKTNNNNRNKNIKNISKIKNTNNSSDFLNKSILTTSNSEIKYGNKLNSNSKNNFLITQINSKLNNNKDKDIEHILRTKTEESSESTSNKYSNISKFDEQNLNFKQKEKLKKLKYLIFNFDRKQKTIGQNKNNLIVNFDKRKKINFCREKKLNKYTPSIHYNKDNLLLNKKFILNTYNTAEDDKISNSLQIKEIKSKLKTDCTNQDNNNIISNEIPRTYDEKETRLKLISKYNLNNIFITNDDNSTLTQKNNLYNKYNSSTCNHYHFHKNAKDYLQIYKKRCKSSFRPNKYTVFNVSKIIKEDYNKAFFPLTHRLITESNIINKEISKERKLDKLLDCFGQQDMKNIKIVKKPIDYKKIRKDLNLYNLNSYLNETNIVLKGAKNVEKLLTNKREKNLVRSAAQKVINEDILVNNYFDFDETLSIKLRRLFERKLFKKFAGDTVLSKNNMKIKKKEKTDGEIFYKILKGDIENFFDIKSLQHLIYKYKTLKRGKKHL